jgi:hypothetical protein
MNAFIAVVLICAKGVAVDACTRDTALDVYVEPVRHETECVKVGQPKAARILGVSEQDGRWTRINCERLKR